MSAFFGFSFKPLRGGVLTPANLLMLYTIVLRGLESGAALHIIAHPSLSAPQKVLRLQKRCTNLLPELLHSLVRTVPAAVSKSNLATLRKGVELGEFAWRVMHQDVQPKDIKRLKRWAFSGQDWAASVVRNIGTRPALNWENATTFKELCTLMQSFLKGELPSNPWYGAPVILDESMPDLDALLQINEHGFMTTDSQPGVCGENEQQRAYLNGWLRNDILDAFLTKLDSTIVAIVNQAHVWRAGKRWTNAARWMSGIPDFFPPRKNYISLTKIRQNKDAEWIYMTNHNFDSEYIDTAQLPSVDAILEREAVFVVLISIERCKPYDLVNAALRALTSA